MKEQQPPRYGQSASQHPQHASLQDSKWDLWLQWADVNGVTPPSLIPYEWVRTNAPRKSHKNTALSVMLKDSCILAKDHSTEAVYSFQDGNQCGQKTKVIDQVKLEAQRVANEAKIAVKHEATALIVTKQWSESIVVDPPVDDLPYPIFSVGELLDWAENPMTGYMLCKGLASSHSARWHEELGCWLVPLYDVHGKLWNIQRIYNREFDNKRFTKGGRITGCFSLLGKLDTNTRQVLVCEGFATGGSLREETGKVVVCAMNAGNIKSVCMSIRSVYPDVSIIVCGDDDSEAELNVGRLKAYDAAFSSNGSVLFPRFCSSCQGRCTDWNDAIQCMRKEGLL